ncbi:MAG: DUF932 domain-containing protein [Polyangia bacterium]
MFTDTVPSVSPQVLSHSHTNEQTFDEVFDKVTSQADLALPDQVLPVSRLRATIDGFIEVPGAGNLSLTEWSRRQLATLLGIRWDRWFASDIVVPADRAEEINRRLRRLGGDWQIRSRRWAAGEPAVGDGVLRAFVGPGYAPIDDLRVFETLQRVLPAQLDEFRFVRLDLTPQSSQYAVVSLSEVDLGIKGRDRHRNGFLIANSEVGARSLSILTWIWRLVCTNGMVAAASQLFRMIHRRRKAESIDGKIAEAFKLLPEKWERAASTLRRARQEAIEDPGAALHVLLENNPQLRPMSQAVYDAFEEDPESNRFGIVQAFTRAAQRFSPERRLMLEEFAGDVAARSRSPEVSF